MKKALLIAAALIVVSTIVGVHYFIATALPADISETFGSATTFTVYSLDPSAKYKAPKESLAKMEKFHDWPVLGKAEVQDPDMREKLRHAVAVGIRLNPGTAAMCFEPRHGIHMQRGTESVDLVICFHCAQIHVYKNGKSARSLLTTGYSYSTFKEIFDANGVPLASERD